LYNSNAATTSDFPGTRNSVVQFTAENQTGNDAVVSRSSRPEKHVNSRPMMLLFGPAVEVHMALLHQQVMVRRGNINPSWLYDSPSTACAAGSFPAPARIWRKQLRPARRNNDDIAYQHSGLPLIREFLRRYLHGDGSTPPRLGLDVQIASDDASAFFNADQAESGTVLFVIEPLARVGNNQPQTVRSTRQLDANMRPARVLYNVTKGFLGNPV